MSRADTMTLTELMASPSTWRKTPRIVKRSCKSNATKTLKCLNLSAVSRLRATVCDYTVLPATLNPNQAGWYSICLPKKFEVKRG